MTNTQKEFKKTNKNSKSLTTIDMQKVEVNNLLKRLGELEDAPLIWINKKVYDMAQEIKRLKEENEQLKKELQTLKMSEEIWLDIDLGVNKENKK
jgi:predicted transcriptional regulator